MRPAARQVLLVFSIFFFSSIAFAGPLEDFMEQETTRMQHVILMAGIPEWPE